MLGFGSVRRTLAKRFTFTLFATCYPRHWVIQRTAKKRAAKSLAEWTPHNSFEHESNRRVGMKRSGSEAGVDFSPGKFYRLGLVRSSRVGSNVNSYSQQAKT